MTNFNVACNHKNYTSRLQYPLITFKKKQHIYGVQCPIKVYLGSNNSCIALCYITLDEWYFLAQLLWDISMPFTIMFNVKFIVLWHPIKGSQNITRVHGSISSFFRQYDPFTIMLHLINL